MERMGALDAAAGFSRVRTSQCGSDGVGPRSWPEQRDAQRVHQYRVVRVIWSMRGDACGTSGYFCHVCLQGLVYDKYCISVGVVYASYFLLPFGFRNPIAGAKVEEITIKRAANTVAPLMTTGNPLRTMRRTSGASVYPLGDGGQSSANDGSQSSSVMHDRSNLKVRFLCVSSSTIDTICQIYNIVITLSRR
jgi:hypothetical protein